MWPYSLFLTIFHFSFLPSCLWLKNTIQPLHCIAFHHICWPFFPSLSCYCCLKFLIYHSFIFPVFIIQSCSATFYKNQTISHFIPFASVETNFPSHSHLSLFLFTMLFSVPSVPCSDLLALLCILCTRSIQSTHAKIFNGLFLAKSQNLHSVFISVAWQLPSILPPFSFPWNIAFPWWFNFLLLLLQAICSLTFCPQDSLFNSTNKTIFLLCDNMIYTSIPSASLLVKDNISTS